MYQEKRNVRNVSQKNGGVLVALIMMIICSLSLAAAGNDVYRANGGPDVDSIYATIRNSSPEYEGTETIVTFENEGMTLVCTLNIPNTPHKPPIVISLNGFGDTRDSLPVGGSGEGIFQRNSRILAENGIASLRVDFRGSGDSDGDYSMMSFSTQISDALAAIRFVSTDSELKHRVDTKRIALLGWSQGGLVASVAASKDKRVDSVALWAPVSHPPIVYEGLLTTEGLRRGLGLLDRESGQIFQLYINNVYINWDVLLGKPFFDDLYNVSPLAAIRKYKKPLMVVAASEDTIIWPQPGMSNVYLTYHEGKEKLVNVEGSDHTFNFATGPEKVDQFIYWATAWYIHTLKHGGK
ncbi:MAG: alpha/beta fold hydrolase [bacterium]|nr:alpha/beta fold hydrolase [bacterium]